MPGNARLARRAMGGRGQMNAQPSMNNNLPGRGFSKSSLLNQQPDLQERPFPGVSKSPFMRRPIDNIDQNNNQPSFFKGMLNQRLQSLRESPAGRLFNPLMNRRRNNNIYGISSSPRTRRQLY